MLNLETPEEMARRFEAERAERDGRQALEDALRDVAAWPNGRLLLRAIVLGWADLIGPSGNDYREGQRSVGRKIADLMDSVDPALFPTLLAENRKAEVERRAAEAPPS